MSQATRCFLWVATAALVFPWGCTSPDSRGPDGQLPIGISGDAQTQDATGSDTLAPAPVGCEGKPDGVACDDGDLCTLNDACVAQICVGGVTDPCDGEGPCRIGSCDRDTGCIYDDAANGTTCSVACFGEASCQGGVCEVVAESAVDCPDSDSPCIEKFSCDPGTGECSVPIYWPADWDCDSDDNVCTYETCDGQGSCETTGEVDTCGAENTNNPCWTWTCTPKTGCIQAAFVEGVACSDGNPCTFNDLCQTSDLGQKLCLGQPVPIDDDNPCTDDTCTDGEVTHAPLDGVSCDPVDACSETGLCDTGVCVPTDGCACAEDSDCPPLPGTCLGEVFCDTSGAEAVCATKPDSAVDCGEASQACHVVACDGETGECLESPAPVGTLCDDQDPCTFDDACQGAALSCEGTAVEVDDQNPCTEDTCVDGVVLHTPTAASPCTPPANSCTDVGTCQGGVCVAPGDACDDGDPCTLDSCENGVCVVVGDACDDGDPCTTDSCQGASCQNLELPCDDGDPCTLDSCQGGECVSVVGGCGDPPATLSLPFPAQGFDVSDDGSVIIAEIVSAQKINVACFAGDGVSVKDSYPVATLDVDTAKGWNGVYVARADHSKISVIAAHLSVGPAGGNNPSTWRLYWLDAGCDVTAGPVDLNDLADGVTQGSNEYFDIDISDSGHRTAAVYVDADGQNSTGKRLALFDSDGSAVVPPIIYGQNGECASTGWGIRVAVHGPSGDMVATCQNHQSDPVMYQRYGADGVAIDPQMVTVQPSAGGLSSWYDSHTVGINDAREFVIVFQQSSTFTVRGAFYEWGGGLTGEVSIGSIMITYDAYRNRHARVQALADGSFLLPEPVNESAIPCVSRFDASGTSLPVNSPGFHCYLTRADAGGHLFAMEEGEFSLHITDAIP